MQTLIYLPETPAFTARPYRERRAIKTQIVISGLQEAVSTHGWSKLRLNGGVRRSEYPWDAGSRMLICRVVTRGEKPSYGFWDFCWLD
jgi:hypothetical protein